ncbi:MAG: hypothetical protein ACKORL_10810 [Phycisphaerales bacterium]|nr:hypothetical protein [Phycisphaerales bacterium]
MNQFLLALRSLAIAVLVFLVLAFFAAKFFGGTLFPKPPRVDFPAVAAGGHSYFLSVMRAEGKAPAFSLRQLDPTDPGDSVLVAPQSDRESDAWQWAELKPLEAGNVVVRFTQRDGRTGRCEVSGGGAPKLTLD